MVCSSKVCSINNFGRERREIMKSKRLQFSADISPFLAHVGKEQASFLLPRKGAAERWLGAVRPRSLGEAALTPDSPGSHPAACSAQENQRHRGRVGNMVVRLRL